MSLIICLELLPLVFVQYRSGFAVCQGIRIQYPEKLDSMLFYKYPLHKPQVLSVEKLIMLELIHRYDEQTLPDLLSQAQQSINSGNALEDLASLLIALAGATQGVHASPLHYAYQADSWNARNAYRLHTCDIRPIDWRLRGAAEREGLL
jgi:hypothetical protein